MLLWEWFRPPRAVLTLFIALMSVCALALGWLGWQVLVQDQMVEVQRRQERLENAADRAMATMEQTLSGADAVVTVAANGETQVTPAGRLAYTPSQPAPPAVAADLFAEAESLEFLRHDFGKAAAAYSRLAESAAPKIRAEALLRLGRALRREGKYQKALEAYTSLEKFGSTPVAGMPASLVARAARCSTLHESGDSVGVERETVALWTELTLAKWNITKPTLETYLSDLRELAPKLALPAGWDERVALSEAAEWAFHQPKASGRVGLLVNKRATSVSWERQSGGWSARLISASTWESLWKKLEQDGGIVLSVVNQEGVVLHGRASTPGPAALRAAAITGLPWSITATSASANQPSQSWTARRRLLVAGLAVFAIVLGLGTLLIARALSREIAVARLQSDFVSAVSHEFRTPLTSIRQLAEMLARGRMETDHHKQRAYDLILGESDRLRRLVESLLDFGRMQARQYKYRTESLEAVEWSRSVAEEFRETVRGRGYIIDFTAPAQGAWTIQGDREALGGALWNLLDNAVKYSPDEHNVHVAVSAANGQVNVSVRDHGPGIPREDLKRVFARFYRGANAKKQGTKGTGIGLAIVKEIVEAHGGTVRARSEIGQGSEFTMVLPCHES
jgi:signal transduction histidine kinase